ncbi:hypothetical protein METBIDRAFT_33112 [Metschnikowia bicuspidata var. bicuspidata NRRL YB-4993]|uniref:Uncharacterized protein n=1 Tax=Metschnikowia bicuspidata var. bicuspidata NRRL YB-4993 TaxID=869754 RepID=A0A1A0H5Q5_9ASCO|nr:hypothetical protein METBIDRAFT_33112 [Metschnikowia bicuspidata var. bicuspidata NRRL YB-4993]OBA19419.1 hypothetical protein METBIDRAFT_33112 [Metschnikowia bicuspidata var. bicuspidata NRRL YB-4993]
MLFAEVSKSMGELATAISKKHQELDQLKNEYERKLRLLDQYLSHLPTNKQSKQDVSGFVENIQNLKSPVTCPHCNNTLFDLLQDTDFVIVPKDRLKAFSVDLSGAENLRVVDKPGILVAPPTGSSPILQQPSAHNQSRLKRTCSYCHKPGHSRAKCFTRLNREPPHQRSQASSTEQKNTLS